MTKQAHLQTFAASLTLPLICAALTLYFGYYVINGNHGLLSYVRTAHETEIRKAELAEVTAGRRALERRVGLLSGDSIDPDLLDERAREMLGLSRPDEVVILRQRR